jgi:hypothetical protein
LATRESARRIDTELTVSDELPVRAINIRHPGEGGIHRELRNGYRPSPDGVKQRRSLLLQVREESSARRSTRTSLIKAEHTRPRRVTAFVGVTIHGRRNTA